MGNIWTSLLNNARIRSYLGLSSVSFAQEHESLGRALALFGLTGREARIYLELLTLGDASAGELARKLGVHRLDIYYDLKSLQKKEIVEGTLSRPMLYKATPLGKILETIEQANRDEWRRKAAALSRLKAASRKLDRTDNQERNGWHQRIASDRIRIISGRKAISTKWLDLLKAARSEVLIAATEKGPAQSIFLGAVDDISRKMRNGVSVKVFTPVTGARDQRIRKVGSKVRHLIASTPVGLCIVDRNTAMIITQPAGTGKSSMGQETALLTNSKSIAEMLRTLFFVGWNTSPTFKERIQRGALPNTHALRKVGK
jgi:sugar-specific transcriptional regulator TrmB